MTRYRRDTNTVSHLVRGSPALDRRVTEVPIAALCISAVTEGELLFGLARRPGAVRLRATVMELVKRVDTLAWDSAAAERYGELRAELERLGRPLGPLDTMIAAHALAADAVLISNDRAFAQAPGLRVEDWTT
ncbi:type II toxin-antitoxin system VapC family toxin [Thalassobaculum sp.]|uniref:type II toxin-antitoxin system VapC family toxin n=1 Tax=Thalassobaculum sp. TaxID=2022740 RepID=UPI0032EB14EB